MVLLPSALAVAFAAIVVKSVGSKLLLSLIERLLILIKRKYLDKFKIEIKKYEKY